MFGPPYSVSSSRGLQGAERVPSRSIDVVMRTPFPCPCCWQPWARHARPQGRRGCQIVGRNPRVQIPKSVMQDALGAHQRLLVVEDSMLRRGHGCAVHSIVGKDITRSKIRTSYSCRSRPPFFKNFLPQTAGVRGCKRDSATFPGTHSHQML